MSDELNVTGRGATETERYTARGFRRFVHELAGDRDRPYELSVVESSLAGEGPHVRVIGGRPITPGRDSVHLSLEDARIVRDALSTFIAEAEAGQLTEAP